MKKQLLVLAGAVLVAGLGTAAPGLGTGPSLCPYADAITQFLPGSAAAGDPLSAIGEPSGEGLYAGSTDTLTLGLGGSLTLHLSSAAYDGPGTDIIVYENPFYVIGGSGLFVEAMFVEVSTDGIVFARFPTHYSGDTGPFLPTAGLPTSWFRGFAGVLPVMANSSLGIEALDVVAGGGDAFDLADLAADPNVISGAVDLGDIGYVRLIDVRGGHAVDSSGNPVWDCGLNNLASADVDAVIAVNSSCVFQGGRPRVELELSPSGFLTIRCEDDNGIQDILPGLTASVDGLPIPFFTLLPFFVITQVSATGFTLLTGPVPPGVFPLTLKVSARDYQGLLGGDALTLP